MIKKIILHTVFLLCAIIPAHAQTLAEARKLYEQGEYAQAKPVFQRYVRQAPNNGNYNLWYGVCCLQTGEAEEAVPHLEKAVKRRVPSGQLWLGQAYDKTYRYEDAISTCEDYIADLKRRRRSTEEADSLLALFRTHLRMLKGVERVCVIDSFVVDKKHFLNAYCLSPQAGKLMSYADYFPHSEKTGTTVFENELGNKLLYSEATAEGKQRLLSSTRLLDDWTPGTSLQGHFPDTLDIAYPYLMSDGITLYYASEGPESLGGLDIFVTRYNTQTDAYLRPDNIGMPFNSPYNDYMYVVDEYANLGWFASDRHQPTDSVCIYVFIPNASKEVYSYEQMDTEQLRALASLTNLHDTWTHPETVDKALGRLNEIRNEERQEVNAPKHAFEFIVDDRRAYHQENDFRSPQALALFRQYLQTRETFMGQCKKLDELRARYAQSTADERASMAPAILDLEKRLLQLESDTKRLAKEVRKAELAP